MAVEIPRVQRFDTQTPESVGRVQANAPNLAEATAPITRGMEAGLKTGLDAQQNYEEASRKASINAWDIKTSDLKNQYEVWHKTEVQKIGLLEGDATKAYADFDEASSKKRKELFTGYEGMTGEFQQLLNKKLDGSVRTLQGLRDIQQSTQASKYQDQVVKDTSKINQDNMMAYGMYVDIKKPETFTELNTFTDNIKKIHISEGVRKGTIKVGPDGKIASMDNAVNVKISEDIGNAMVHLIKSLNGAGKVAEGKKLMQNYDEYFNTKDRAALIADSDEANVRNMALALKADLVNKSGKEALDEVNANTTASEAVKFKAKELIDTDDRLTKNANDRKKEDSYKSLYQMVESGKLPDGTPIVKWSQVADTALYKNNKGLLGRIEIDSLQERVDAPKITDPDKKLVIQNSLHDGTFFDKSPSALNKLLVGLNAQDRSRYQALHESGNKKKPGLTESEARVRVNTMGSQMMDDARLSGLIPKKGNPSDWSQRDRDYYSGLTDAWAEHYAKNVPDNMTDPSNQKSNVRSFVNSYLQSNPPPRVSWWQSGKNRDLKALPELSRRANVPGSPALTSKNIDSLGVKSSAPAPRASKPTNTSVDLLTMNSEQFSYWEKQYIKETGLSSAPDDVQVFQAWINKQVSK